MNNITLYQPEKHKEMLMIWAKQWGWNETVIDMFPTTGLIVEDVCCAFLYETNSKVCIIEGFICNKEVKKELRDKSLDQVVDAIMLMGRAKGYKYIKYDTRHQAVVDRGLKHGFKLTPYTYQALYRSL